MFTCRCGCAETMHSKKWGCGTCGCMKFVRESGWRGECENHTQRDGWQEKLTAPANEIMDMEDLK